MITVKVGGQTPADLGLALKRINLVIKDSAVNGVEQAAIDTMVVAKASAPKKSGTLSKSGYVTRNRTGKNKVQIELGFGGPVSGAYAGVVHSYHPWFQSAMAATLGGYLTTAGRFVIEGVETKTVPQVDRKNIPNTPGAG